MAVGLCVVATGGAALIGVGAAPAAAGLGAASATAAEAMVVAAGSSAAASTIGAVGTVSTVASSVATAATTAATSSAIAGTAAGTAVSVATAGSATGAVGAAGAGYMAGIAGAFGAAGPAGWFLIGASALETSDACSLTCKPFGSDLPAWQTAEWARVSDMESLTESGAVLADCWKPILHNTSEARSSGMFLTDLLADAAIRHYEVHDAHIIVENVFDERFRIEPVLLPSHKFALHASLEHMWAAGK